MPYIQAYQHQRSASEEGREANLDQQIDGNWDILTHHFLASLVPSLDMLVLFAVFLRFRQLVPALVHWLAQTWCAHLIVPEWPETFLAPAVPSKWVRTENDLLPALVLQTYDIYQRLFPQIPGPRRQGHYKRYRWDLQTINPKPFPPLVLFGFWGSASSAMKLVSLGHFRRCFSNRST